MAKILGRFKDGGEREAILAAIAHIENHVAPPRCDNEGSSHCNRCNAVYLARVLREILAAPAALHDVTDDPAKCRTCGRSFYEEPATLPEGSLLLRALERMDRARAILTNSNPRPECNWGVLDTADIRAMLAAEKEK